jgi:hypothetical protein
MAMIVSRRQGARVFAVTGHFSPGVCLSDESVGNVGERGSLVSGRSPRFDAELAKGRRFRREGFVLGMACIGWALALRILVRPEGRGHLVGASSTRAMVSLAR